MAELLPQQRHQHILDELRLHGQVRVTDLAAQLGISEMTVRRDLSTLEAAGELVKVHGGATRQHSAASDEPGFSRKLSLQSAEKEAIARRAARLVSPGMTVGLTSGTTTFALARQLIDVDGLTVVTNSPRVADVFYAAESAGGPTQTVLLTGGVRTPSDALVGPLALGALAQLNVDLFFMGVHGVRADRGFSTPNLLEAQVCQAFLASAARTAVVADHAKWGVTGLSVIAPLEAADLYVTDDQLPPIALEQLGESITDVIVAD
ncbi:DeoR/GlpR family DNA-binding transcription regulator [Zhihengliuella alba]|uniref:DeoR/GlpR family DNA-binding transcription regulator n=1 Tax=Zhihengliuella alba TaxID=547018 RepID=A0ABP7DVI6_9MICC